MYSNSTGPPPDVRREIEYERSPPRPAEAKLAPNPPSHWNRNSEMASSYNQRPVYYHPGNGPPPPPTGLPPHSALSMWPRPPSGYGEFINPLSTMPPHWHQDPAAMAWIHHRLMMPMPPSGAPHPHNYMTSGHLAHGVNGTRLNQSPSTSNSSAVHSEELVFTCDICGKTCNSKDSLHQVRSLFHFVTCSIQLTGSVDVAAHAGARPAAAFCLRTLRRRIHDAAAPGIAPGPAPAAHFLTKLQLFDNDKDYAIRNLNNPQLLHFNPHGFRNDQNQECC